MREFNFATTRPRRVAASVAFHRIGPPSACTPARSVPVSEDGIARLYTLGGRWYACMYSRGAPTRLDWQYSGFGVRGPLLSGAFVAVIDYAYDGAADIEVDEYSVRVIDLRTDNVTSSRSPNNAPIRSLVLSTRGGVAWIACPGQCEVRRRQAGESTEVIARSTSIDPESLQLQGDLLSWTEDGAVQNATLR
jgi:hypothetical protein